MGDSMAGGGKGRTGELAGALESSCRLRTCSTSVYLGGATAMHNKPNSK